MIQTTLKICVNNLVSPWSFPVIQRSPRFQGLVSFRKLSNPSMVSKRRNVSAVSSPSSSSEPGGAVKDDGVHDMHDSYAFEKMTVQQLRTKLRSLGLPARGSKHELVSALKNHQNRNGDANVKSLEDVDNQVLSKKKRHNIGNNEEKEAIALQTGDSDPDIKVVPQGARPEDDSLRIKAMQHISQEELSVQATDIKGKRSIRANRKVSSESASVDIVSGEKSIRAKRKVSSDIASVNVETGKRSVQRKRKISSNVASLDIGDADQVDHSVNKNEPWTIFAHKRPQQGWIAYNPKTMRPPPLTCDTKHVKLISWNVNGLRALLKMESFSALELAQREDFDVLCLQETKLQEKDVEAIKQSLIEGYENSFWTCSVSKLGYSGTAIISRIQPRSVRYGLGMADHDSEGRLVTVEFENFYLLSCYVPNSGDGLRRLSYRITEWDCSLSNYMKELEKSKPVILTGDLNCAHEEIDIYNPAGNRRSAGFTDEERQSFQTNFLKRGFVDTFRKQHPGVVGYTYWGYRHGGRKTNRGWRLDYFLVSESIADDVHDSYILPDVTGSDHSPIGLILKL